MLSQRTAAVKGFERYCITDLELFSALLLYVSNGVKDVLNTWLLKPPIISSLKLVCDAAWWQQHRWGRVAQFGCSAHCRCVTAHPSHLAYRMIFVARLCLLAEQPALERWAPLLLLGEAAREKWRNCLKIVKVCCSKALQKAWNVLCYPEWPSFWLSQSEEWSM